MRHRLTSKLNATLPHGLLRRDGRVVGVYLTEHGAGFNLVGIVEGDDGVPSGFRCAVPSPGHLPEVTSALAEGRRLRAQDSVCEDLLDIMLRPNDPLGGLGMLDRFEGVVSELASDMRGDGDAAVAAYMASLRGTLSAYRDTLDPLAVRVCSDSGHRFRLRAETWATLQPTPEGPSGLALALASHPGLSRTAIAAAEAAGRTFPITRQGVDAILRATLALDGSSPWEVEGAMTCERVLATLPDSDLRAMRDQSWCGGLTDVPALVAGYVGRLPEGSRPASDRDWEAALRLMPVIFATWDWASAEDRPAMLGLGGGWEALETELGHLTLDLSSREADAVHRLATDFHRQVVGPALDLADAVPGSTGGASSRADAVLHAGRTVSEIVAAALAYDGAARDAVQVTVRDLPGTVPVPDAWEEGVPDLAHGATSFRCLTTLADVHAHMPVRASAGDGAGGVPAPIGPVPPEVLALARGCASGDRRLVVARPEGAVASVVSLDVRDPSKPVTVAAHWTLDGSAPTSEAIAEVGAYVDLVNSQGLVRRERIRDMYDVLRVGVSTNLANAAGYDHLVPGNWEAVRDAWAPFLPHGLRDASPNLVAEASAGTAAGRGGWWRPEAPSPSANPGPGLR